MKHRLAVVTTHPTQYYAPWFRTIVERGDLELEVFYLWNFGVTPVRDSGFEREIQWDIPLLNGYPNQFVPNRSRSPGTQNFFGIYNPDLNHRLTTFKPDSILTLGYHYASFYRLVFSELGRTTPLLLRGDSHSLLPRTGPLSGVKRLVRKKIFSAYDRFLYVGEANRRYFLEHGAALEQLFFSPHSIDMARFQGGEDAAISRANALRGSLGIKPDQLVVLFSGKFEQKKQPLLLLEAFLGMDRDTSAQLVFVGSGPLEQRLRHIAGEDPRIHFLPFQNQSEMPAVYKLADIVVLPSLGPYETWGLTVNEALCLGTPVIVSNHVGCAADLVQNQESGLIVQAGSIDALRSALSVAVSPQTDLKSWGSAGRKLVAQYSFEEAYIGLKEAIDSL